MGAVGSACQPSWARRLNRKRHGIYAVRWASHVGPRRKVNRHKLYSNGVTPIPTPGQNELPVVEFEGEVASASSCRKRPQPAGFCRETTLTGLIARVKVIAISTTG